MAPRGFTLPPASTQSAKQARSAFFCSLCQKGYSRMNEFEAHESSYDHQHKKRLKEMKEMQRQVVQSTGKKDKDKEGGGGLMQIKLGGAGSGVGGGSSGGGAGFKKSGFKNAFAPANDEDEEDKKDVKKEEETVGGDREDVDSDITDEEDDYDPRRPTGCTPGCKGHVAVAMA